MLVLESAPAARGESYMINLFGSGFDAAARMQVLPQLSRLSYDFDSVEFLNVQGRSTARLPFKALRERFSGRLMSLMRGDLERVLIEQSPPNVAIRFGCCVVQVRAPVGGIEVDLDSGGMERCDVLIGADGLHSRIRDLVFGDGSLWFRFMGFHTAAFSFRDGEVHAALQNRLQIVSVPGRLVGFYPVLGGEVATFFVHRAQNSAPPLSPVQAVCDTYGDLGGHVPRALQAVKLHPTLLYEQVGQVVMRHWCRGRVALLGDACQAVSLLPGQGASLSMAAAFVLGEELCSGVHVRDALERYEHRVRPAIVRIRRGVRKTAEWLVPATTAGIRARDLAIRLSRLPGLSGLIRPATEAINEDVLTAPVMPRLEMR